MRKKSFFLFLLFFAAFQTGCNNGKRHHFENDPVFCKHWNPDFSSNGNRCCWTSPEQVGKKVKRVNLARRHHSFCNEMTHEQVNYVKAAAHGKYPDFLKIISHRKEWVEQAVCSVNDGFLNEGKPVIPSPHNSIRLRFPDRCTNFGTDAMVGMLEWIGRQVHMTYSPKKYPGVHLLVGDVAAPRGGNLWGHSLRMVHRSHTNGQDVDIGFLAIHGKKSPTGFTREFDAYKNLWLIKHIFSNPYACVKIAFLDKSCISKIGAIAHHDPEWRRIRPYIIHAPGHHNHIHVRIGNGPGKPGCYLPSLNPTDLDEGDDDDDDDTAV